MNLCEECFPGWREVEILTMTPVSPCAECGRWDQRRGSDGGWHADAFRVNVFRTDPRVKA